MIAYPTTSSQFAPLWFARDVGLYEKYGLDGQLVFIQGGSILLQAILAGQVHAAQNGIAETMVAVLRGGDVKILGVTSNIFPYTLIAGKGAKGPKDLTGGRIAVNHLGDVSAIASRVALRKLGLNPDKDVTMLQVGGSPQRLAALQSGSVQGAALDFMSSLRLSKQGYTVLAQVSLSTMPNGAKNSRVGLTKTIRFFYKNLRLMVAFALGENEMERRRVDVSKVDLDGLHDPEIEALKSVQPPADVPFKIRKMGHAVLVVRDIDVSVQFYTQLLGFKVSDVYPDSMVKGRMVFMRFNEDHHGLGLVGQGEEVSKNRELHHIAFEVSTIDEVFRASDHLTKNGVQVDFDGRRRAGSQVSVEFRDPDGHSIEIFWGLDKVNWDGEARPPEEWVPKHSLEDAVDHAPPGQDTTLADPSLRQK